MEMSPSKNETLTAAWAAGFPDLLKKQKVVLNGLSHLKRLRYLLTMCKQLTFKTFTS